MAKKTTLDKSRFQNIALLDSVLVIKPVAVYTGPVRRLVFAIHTGLSLFLKFL